MAPVLQTVGLEKKFGGLTATSNVSLGIEPGARHALIGPNGAGKTTLINLLTGVLKPTAGRILLDGRDITTLEPHARVRLGIARTFQINQLFADLTPLETVGLAVSERLGTGADWRRIFGNRPDLVDETLTLLESFRLFDVMNERTAILPYGQQRLLEIAAAVASRPRVLLLDEPAAGVPEDERHAILATVGALPADVTVVLIEHDMDLVFQFAKRISVLVNGALFAEGTPEAWLSRVVLLEDGRRAVAAEEPGTPHLVDPETPAFWCHSSGTSGMPKAVVHAHRFVHEVDRVSRKLGRRLTFLVGKPGLDGHSNGAEQIAVRARDAGMEVIYQGIRLTPAEIVETARAERAHVVGLSILSGSHLPLVREVMTRMRASGLDRVPVVVGGIIPPADADTLKEIGVHAVYTPKDFQINQIMSDVVRIVEAANGKVA